MLYFKSIILITLFIQLFLLGSCKKSELFSFNLIADSDQINKLYVKAPLSYSLIRKSEKSSIYDMNAPYSYFVLGSKKFKDSIAISVIYHNLYSANDYLLFDSNDICFDTLGNLTKCHPAPKLRLEKAILQFRKSIINKAFPLTCDIYGCKSDNKYIFKAYCLTDGIKIAYTVKSPDFNHLKNDFFDLEQIIKLGR
jgi:hypothetical protein